LALLTKRSEKYKSTSPSAIPVKNQRKTITIKEKLDVISQPEKREHIADICHIRHTHSSVHTIHDNAEKIKQSARLGTEVGDAKIYYSRSSATEHIQKMLNSWLKAKAHQRL
jgi:hypothetical protein